MPSSCFSAATRRLSRAFRKSRNDDSRVQRAMRPTVANAFEVFGYAYVTAGVVEVLCMDCSGDRPFLVRRELRVLYEYQSPRVLPDNSARCLQRRQ